MGDNARQMASAKSTPGNTIPDMTPSGDSRISARIRRQLLSWYDRHRRDLPWRKSTDPYRVWLSEMMLQQTQVATVIPYYERFTKAYPTVRRLAAADLKDVLGLWAGLGYYARARNMHRAAQIVVREYGGKFPGTSEQLKALPGIGPYSAAAIASISFGERAAVVDGNVNRVISRLLCIRDELSTATAKKKIAAAAQALMPRSRCGDFNQAMMELGARICTPGASASCEECPLRRDCLAVREGCAETLPVKKKKAGLARETHVVAAIRRGQRWLAVQRPENGLWGGLWELPTAVCNGSRARSEAAKLIKKCGLRVDSRTSRPFCEIDRQLSHKQIRFVGIVHTCNIVNASPEKKERARWLAMSQLRALPMSTAMRAVIEALEASINDARAAGLTSRRASSAYPRRSR